MHLPPGAVGYSELSDAVSIDSSMSEHILLDSSSWADMWALEKSMALSKAYDFMLARQACTHVSAHSMSLSAGSGCIKTL